MSRFLSSFRTFVSAISDTPNEFIEAAGLVCLSTIAMGRRWIPKGNEIRPNLFVMLIAGSSRDRKSTALSHALDLIDDVEPERIGPDDFTAEALVRHMSTPFKGDRPAKNVQTIGIREFGTYLAQAQTYGATASAQLCKLYDGDSFKQIRATREPLQVDKPRLTIIAACAFGMFERYADPKDWNTGFYARFLFIPALNRKPRNDIPPGQALVERECAMARLVDLRRELLEVSGPMAMLPAAEEVFRSFLTSFGPESTDPAENASMERLYNTTLKLALLYQIDLAPERPIGPEAMSLATAFGKVAWAGFQRAYRTSAGDDSSRLFRKLWKAISESKECGVDRSILLRNFHLAAGRFDQILRTLIANGIVELREVANPNGRGRGAKKQVAFAKLVYTDETDLNAFI